MARPIKKVTPLTPTQKEKPWEKPMVFALLSLSLIANAVRVGRRAKPGEDTRSSRELWGENFPYRRPLAAFSSLEYRSTRFRSLDGRTREYNILRLIPLLEHDVRKPSLCGEGNVSSVSFVWCRELPSFSKKHLDIILIERRESCRSLRLP